MGDTEIEAAVEIDEDFRTPEGLAQCFARNNFARIGEEEGEHVSGLGLEANGCAFATKLACGGVEIEEPELETDRLWHDFRNQNAGRPGPGVGCWIVR